MGQSDLPKSRTQSGKINAKWYFERLKFSPKKNRRYSNSTITVVRGTTATQGQLLHKYHLKSPTKSFEHQFNEQVFSSSSSSLKIEILFLNSFS